MENNGEPLGYPDLPLGFGMALVQNTKAFKAFSELPDEEKNRVIEDAHLVESKNEMSNYVGRLAQREQ